MKVTSVSNEDFVDLYEKDFAEGLVPLGAGGKPEDWVHGIFGELRGQGITEAASAEELFSAVYLLHPSKGLPPGEGEGRTDLALILDMDAVNVGKLAAWRLGFGDCMWVSDYVVEWAF